MRVKEKEHPSEIRQSKGFLRISSQSSRSRNLRGRAEETANSGVEVREL